MLLKLSCKARRWLSRTNVWSEEVQGGARRDVVTRKAREALLPLEKCHGSPGASFDLTSFVILCVSIFLFIILCYMLSLSLSLPALGKKGRHLRMFVEGVGLYDSSLPWV